MSVLLILVSSIGAVALMAGRPRVKRKPIVSSRESQETRTQSGLNNVRTRNLSLQPEAFNLARRVGQRFSPAKREQSILIGRLTLGSEQRISQITRTQTDDGEQVEINIAGSPGTLTWDSAHGALSSGIRAGGSDRDLIERLVLDSADEFVLAQLRRASYYTVARNVRPAEAGGSDSYTGPTWNLVRIGEPEQISQNKPQSLWRLFCINTSTGLIDKIISQEQGQTITAEVSGWVNQVGETLPTHITWKRNNGIVMELTIITASFGPS